MNKTGYKKGLTHPTEFATLKQLTFKTEYENKYEINCLNTHSKN